MDIAGISTALSMTDLSNQVGVAMLSKSLDTIEILGDGMVKMMEQSVYPNLGQNIDIAV